MKMSSLISSFTGRILLLGVAILAFSCNTQQGILNHLSDETRALVDVVSQQTYIGTERIGRQQDISPDYQIRQQLMDAASIEELENLVGHKNPVVSLTAFEGMKKKQKDSCNGLLKTYSKSCDLVNVINGDLMQTMSTLDYAYTEIMGYEIQGTQGMNEAELNYGIPDAERISYENKIAECQAQLEQ